MNTANGEEKEFFCPVNAVLSLLSARWTLHIVHSLAAGPRRFNELAREVGVNPRTLRERLRGLAEQEIVARRVVSEVPPNVEYSLTDKGMSLSGIVDRLADWGHAWMKPICAGGSADDSRATGKERNHARPIGS